MNTVSDILTIPLAVVVILLVLNTCSPIGIEPERLVQPSAIGEIKSWSATAIARRRLNTCIQRSETRIKRAVGMSL